MAAKQANGRITANRDSARSSKVNSFVNSNRFVYQGTSLVLQ